MGVEKFVRTIDLVGYFEFLRLPFRSIEHLLAELHFLVADGFCLDQSID